MVRRFLRIKDATRYHSTSKFAQGLNSRPCIGEGNIREDNGESGVLLSA